jgi:hypothetical protein
MFLIGGVQTGNSGFPLKACGNDGREIFRCAQNDTKDADAVILNEVRDLSEY